MRPSSLRLLREMLAAEEREDWDDASVICEGIVCMIGYRNVHRSTVNHLLNYMAVSADQYDKGGVRYFTLNQTGRIIARNPEMADKIMAAIISGRSFTYTKDDKVKYLERKPRRGRAFGFGFFR